MSEFHDRQGGGPRRVRWRRGPGPFVRFEAFESGAGDDPDYEGDADYQGRPAFAAGPVHGHWHGGPPPWRGGRRARRGDIRWALLVSLLDGPAHGYELITRLETRTGGVWRPSAGSVYPTLQLLEEEGLTRGRDEDGKRVYELTDEGRTAATEASHRIGEGPWTSPAGHHAALRQAMKGLVLAVRQVAAAGDADQVATASAVISEARQRLYRILAGDPAGEGTGMDGESTN